MRKRLTASVLLVLAVLATVAIGQPPPAPSAPKADLKKPEKKPADSTDAAIAAALANDPDVKMARAKIQLAEAELAKARLAVTQKVLAAQSVVQDAKLAVATAELEVHALLNMYKSEQVSNYETRPQYQLTLTKVETAKAKLATAETELKLLTGSVGGDAVGNAVPQQLDAALGLMWLQENEKSASALRINAAYRDLLERKKIEGPLPDRIRAALDKPVKLGPKGQEVTFTQALEAFKKEAGLDVSVRGTLPEKVVDSPKNPREVELRPAAIDSDGETLPVGAWLQMFEDQYRVQFYVREYGLLISRRESAPKDAPTLTEFWKQKPAKEPKGESPPNK